MLLCVARPIRHFAQGVEQVMDYKTVMVGLALDRPNDACLRVAGDIAERFGARIIGVAASDLRPPMYFADGDFAQKLLDRGGRRHPESDCRSSRRSFALRSRSARQSVEWRSARSLPVPYMLQQARAADILVVGARAETLVDPSAAPDPSDLVMQAGRPLIVVPPSRGVARSEKRSGRLEGCARSAPGRIRRVADPGCRKGSHDCGNSRTGRAIAPMRCRMLPTWRRGCAATASRRTPSFPKRPAASANSSRTSPPMSARAP